MSILNVNSANGAGMAFSVLKGSSAYEVAVKNGFEGTEQEWLESLKGGNKPVFFISAENPSNSVMPAMVYYDNPNKFATVDEMVDAYMAGTAYFFDDHYGTAHKIIGFGISSGLSGGEVKPQFTKGYDNYLNHWFCIKDSTGDDLRLAMSRYLP